MDEQEEMELRWLMAADYLSPWEFKRRQEPRPRVRQLKTEYLPYPHYTDTMWNQARLVFGREQKCQHVNYSDRMWEWDRDAAERAGTATGPLNTAAEVERWLTVYHGKQATIKYIMVGCNVSSGYAYWVYGYDLADDDA